MQLKFLPFLLLIILFSFRGIAQGQSLQAGFDKQEYLELLRISSRFGDSAYQSKIAPPKNSKFIYRSPVMGLDNLWDLWHQERGVAVISIRGTTESATSWLANFYAAMVPAKGRLQLSETETWDYELAKNPDAAVHVGWLVAMAFLSKDILPKIDSAYQKGTKEFIVLGHSQGGAIAYLLTSHLYHLKASGRIPSDIQFKTYCSAGPKPGNLFFAYEYEDMTKNGWAFNVVNTADWVPETPMSIQTMEDLNPINPFAEPKKIFRNTKFPQNLVLRYAFNRLDKPSKKARKNYQKYLGSFVGKSVKKKLTGFTAPEFHNSMDYVRTGNQIVLMADEAYYEKFPQVKEKIFVNHLHAPYIYLAEKYGMEKSEQPKQWVLEALNWKDNDFQKLYANKKPQIIFNPFEGKIEGNSGCNSFSGNPKVDGGMVDFNVPIRATKKYCEGNGEMAFFEALQSVNRFAITNNQLRFYRNNEVILQFSAL